MMRPIYGQAEWPRDFPGWMYLGTLIHLVNVALHPDAEADDVTLAPYFEDRPSTLTPGQASTADEQMLIHDRAMNARATVLRGMRQAQAGLAWLSKDGTFSPVPQQAWGEGATLSDLNKLLVRFALPDSLVPPGEVATFGNAPSVYVPMFEAAAIIRSTNARTHIPNPPSDILSRMGSSAEFGLIWPLAAAVVWVATRRQDLAVGAACYAEEMASHGFSRVRDGASEILAREEIAYHHCGCRRPVCQCWNNAIRAVTNHAAAGRIVAQGFCNDVGNQDDVPRGAWSGTVKFADSGSLEPARHGGDRWTGIVFSVHDMLEAFPPPPAVSDPLTQVAPSADAKREVYDAMIRLASQFDEAGTPVRSVTASMIAKHWPQALGAPPKVGAVTTVMKGKGKGGRPSSR